jgi:hypothetical protein
MIAGSYMNNVGIRYGFVRSADGKITLFNPPRSTETQVWDINNEGAIVGWYWKGLKGNSPFYAFLRTP